MLEPPLLIDCQRILDSERTVIQGPTGWNARWVWTLTETERVAVYKAGHTHQADLYFIDRAATPLLSSNERFGFDPVTSKCPRLRRMQQYSSIILKGVLEKQDLTGGIVIPATIPIQCSRVKVRLYVSLPASTDDALLQEMHNCAGSSCIIARCESEVTSFIVLRALDLFTTSPRSAEEAIVVSSDRCVINHKAGLFAVLARNDSLEGRYNEVHIGEAVIEEIV